MRRVAVSWSTTVMAALAGLALASAWTTGCGAGFGLVPNPIFNEQNPDAGGGGGGSGGSGDDDDDDGFFGGGGGRTEVDPCDEPQNRKFISISMQNRDSIDYIHYFLILVAFPNDGTNNGAVCAEDIDLYESFGYQGVESGTVQIGNFCFDGPFLFYFHEAGNFRGAGGELASGIAPALGTQSTFDNFFTSQGAIVPVPDLILFHNPGTGDGEQLLVSNQRTSCDSTVVIGDPDCAQDSFYYVTETDDLAGSTGTGDGSARRVLADVQGSGCECGAFTSSFQVLAPSGASGTSALCNEFLRGGAVEFAFIRDDTVDGPQLLWRVTDGGGGVVHDFDSSSEQSP